GNLNLGTVTLSNAANNVTVKRSQLGNLIQNAGGNVGQNTITENTITGMVDLEDFSSKFTQTADVVDHNRFSSTAWTLLTLRNTTGTAVQDNTFACSSVSSTAIFAEGECDDLLIQHNQIEMTGGPGSIGIDLTNFGPVPIKKLTAKVFDNRISTGGSG